MPTVEELLELDLLTLREHTERSGAHLEPEQHAKQVRASLLVSQVCAVRRAGALVAYAMLSPQSSSSWFVRAFNVHPSHRNAAVIRSLLRQVVAVVRREAISELQSHVYKANQLSMAFHRRLGFRITNENAVAVEFTASVGNWRLTRL